MTTKTAIEIAAFVNKNMPSIGFLSRAKRIEGYNIACSMIEQLTTDENGEIDMEKAAEAVAMLTHMNKKFHKGLYMTTLNFERLPLGYLNELAYQFAVAARQNRL